MLEVALVENVQREDIGPMEAATAYKRLAEEFQLTQEEVAKRVGKVVQRSRTRSDFYQVPEIRQESLSGGKITEGHARALLSIPDSGERSRTFQALLHSGGSVREAEAQARQSRAVSPAKPTSLPRKDPQDSSD